MKKQETQLFDAISANTKTNGVFVPDDSSDGYKELWIRQLEQFSLVSRDVAVTIVAQYPSPRLLMKAYDACATEAEREQLVENVIVRRGTERRVGPKMSKMLYAFMCSGNGDEILEWKLCLLFLFSQAFCFADKNVFYSVPDEDFQGDFRKVLRFKKMNATACSLARVEQKMKRVLLWNFISAWKVQWNLRNRKNPCAT